MEDTRAKLASVSHQLRSGPPRPVKATPSRVTLDMTPVEAFRATLADCLVQVTANAGLLRAGRSVEGLHQLRIGFRRLEVALGAFGREFGVEWLKQLRGRAKVLSGRLAAARDLDVFVCDLLDGPAASPAAGRDGFILLRRRAEAARDAAWHEANACIAAADFAMFLDDVAGLAQSRLPLGRRQNLLRVAGRLLARRGRQVRKRGREARSGEERDLHRLRIALKKLRYTAEFFIPLYPKKKTRRYLKKVRRLQDHLGDLNDIAHAHRTAAKLMGVAESKAGSDDLCLAAGAVIAWHGARRARLAGRALKRYRKFRHVKPFWT